MTVAEEEEVNKQIGHFIAKGWIWLRVITSSGSNLYLPGELVKVATVHLPLAQPTTKSRKLQAKFVGPFQVLEQTNVNVYRVQLPVQYRGIMNKFNAADLRPWVEADRHPAYFYRPAEPHPTADVVAIVRITDRKGRRGRQAKKCTPAQRKAQYLVAYRSHPDSLLWVNDTIVHSQVNGTRMARAFEQTLSRTAELPCEGVQSYPAQLAQDDDWDGGINLADLPRTPRSSSSTSESSETSESQIRTTILPTRFPLI